MSKEADPLQRMLAALASPTRLAILQHLSEPRGATAVASAFGISRQAARKHLDALSEAGLVRARPATRGAGLVFEVEPGATQLLRQLVSRAIPRGQAPAVSPTLADAPRASGRRAPGGAGLVLLDGEDDATFLPLPPGSAWVLGRSPDADVRLLRDPYVSARHALLRFTSAGWTVEDLGSTNGTHVDFRPLRARDERPLEVGSVLTLGRSHILVRGGG